METRKQWILMAIGVAGNLLYGIIHSVHPPFFPSVAEAKGATAAQYSFVFSFLNFGALFGSPVVGHLGKWLSPKTLYVGGDLLSCFCVGMFGIVAYIESTGAFLITAYVLRLLEGFAFAAGMSSIMSILISSFPTRVATVSASVEVLISLGCVIGPMYGGVLYSIGGFYLPFVVIAVAQLVQVIFALIYLPSNKAEGKEEKPDGKQSNATNKKELSFLEVFKHPTILIPFLENTINVSYVAQTNVTLEPFLHSVNASQNEINLVFSVTSFSCMIMQFIVGPLCDRMTHPTLLPVVFYPLVLASLAFLGPSRLIPPAWVQTSYASILLANAFLFLSISPSVVTTFKRAHSATNRLGYSEKGSTPIVLSSFMVATMQLGFIFGSTVGGLFVNLLGYRDMTLIFMGLATLLFVVDVVYLWNDVRQVRCAKQMGQGDQSEASGLEMPLKVEIRTED